jgi:hypothetical protein
MEPIQKRTNEYIDAKFIKERNGCKSDKAFAIIAGNDAKLIILNTKSKFFSSLNLGNNLLMIQLDMNITEIDINIKAKKVKLELITEKSFKLRNLPANFMQALISIIGNKKFEKISFGL